VVVAALVGACVAFFLSRGAAKPQPSEELPAEAAAPAAPSAPAQYIALDPPFVVNLADASGDRYLQVEVQLMTRTPKMEETLTQHMPVIRNRLLLLFSQQTVEGVRTREAKEALQAEALKEVQAVLTEATGKPGIEALYFTSFVTQ
jgi:flagellar protein FliL